MLTFEQYYACLFGDLTEDEIVREYGLRPGKRSDLDEWLGTNEAEAARQGMDLDAGTPEFRGRVMDALENAIDRALLADIVEALLNGGEDDLAAAAANFGSASELDDDVWSTEEAEALRAARRAVLRMPR